MSSFRRDHHQADLILAAAHAACRIPKEALGRRRLWTRTFTGDPDWSKLLSHPPRPESEEQRSQRR